MSYSLNFEPLEHRALLDAALLSSGKALYLATAFESKCHYVLHYFRITERFTPGGQHDYAALMAEVLKKKQLKHSIDEMANFPEFTSEEFDRVTAAKDARNFIAHRGAVQAHVQQATPQVICEHLVELRTQVATLALGDAVVSRWSCKIDGTHGSSMLPEHYPHLIDEWVFGWWDGIVPPKPSRMTLRQALDLPEAAGSAGNQRCRFEVG